MDLTNYQIDPERDTITPDDDSLYPYVNNDIEYGLFEDIVDSYYLDSQIKDDFQCDHDCYSQQQDPTVNEYSNTCTHEYHHIAQSIHDLSYSTQQNNLHTNEGNASLFADDTMTPCDFSIIDQHPAIENTNDTHMLCMPLPSTTWATWPHSLGFMLRRRRSISNLPLSSSALPNASMDCNLTLPAARSSLTAYLSMGSLCL